MEAFTEIHTFQGAVNILDHCIRDCIKFGQISEKMKPMQTTAGRVIKSITQDGPIKEEAKNPKYALLWAFLLKYAKACKEGRQNTPEFLKEMRLLGSETDEYIKRTTGENSSASMDTKGKLEETRRVHTKNIMDEDRGMMVRSGRRAEEDDVELEKKREGASGLDTVAEKSLTEPALRENVISTEHIKRDSGQQLRVSRENEAKKSRKANHVSSASVMPMPSELVGRLQVREADSLLSRAAKRPDTKLDSNTHQDSKTASRLKRKYNDSDRAVQLERNTVGEVTDEERAEHKKRSKLGNQPKGVTRASGGDQKNEEERMRKRGKEDKPRIRQREDLYKHQDVRVPQRSQIVKNEDQRMSETGYKQGRESVGGRAKQGQFEARKRPEQDNTVKQKGTVTNPAKSRESMPDHRPKHSREDKVRQQELNRQREDALNQKIARLNELKSIAEAEREADDGDEEDFSEGDEDAEGEDEEPGEAEEPGEKHDEERQDEMDADRAFLLGDIEMESDGKSDIYVPSRSISPLPKRTGGRSSGEPVEFEYMSLPEDEPVKPKVAQSSRHPPPIATRYVFSNPCKECKDHDINCRVTYTGRSCYFCRRSRLKCEGKGGPHIVRDVEDNERVVGLVYEEREVKASRKRTRSIKPEPNDPRDLDDDRARAGPSNRDLKGKGKASSHSNSPSNWAEYQEFLRRKFEPISAENTARPPHWRNWDAEADNNNNEVVADICRSLKTVQEQLGSGLQDVRDEIRRGIKYLDYKSQLLDYKVDKISKKFAEFNERFGKHDMGLEYMAAKFSLYTAAVEVFENTNELSGNRIYYLQKRVEHIEKTLLGPNYYASERPKEEAAEIANGTGANEKANKRANEKANISAHKSEDDVSGSITEDSDEEEGDKADKLEAQVDGAQGSNANATPLHSKEKMQAYSQKYEGGSEERPIELDADRPTLKADEESTPMQIDRPTVTINGEASIGLSDPDRPFAHSLQSIESTKVSNASEVGSTPSVSLPHKGDSSESSPTPGLNIIPPTPNSTQTLETQSSVEGSLDVPESNKATPNVLGSPIMLSVPKEFPGISLSSVSTQHSGLSDLSETSAMNTETFSMPRLSTSTSQLGLPPSRRSHSRSPTPSPVIRHIPLPAPSHAPTTAMRREALPQIPSAGLRRSPRLVSLTPSPKPSTQDLRDSDMELDN